VFILLALIMWSINRSTIVIFLIQREFITYFTLFKTTFFVCIILYFQATLSLVLKSLLPLDFTSNSNEHQLSIFIEYFVNSCIYLKNDIFILPAVLRSYWISNWFIYSSISKAFVYQLQLQIIDISYFHMHQWHWLLMGTIIIYCYEYIFIIWRIMYWNVYKIVLLVYWQTWRRIYSEKSKNDFKKDEICFKMNKIIYNSFYWK